MKNIGRNIKGKLIVIDGADGAGKATQAKLLVDKLVAEGYSTELIDFPQYYDNFFGKLVGEYLTGKFGKAVEVDPYLASLLYAGDRFESAPKIKKWLSEGKIVVTNRYSASNAAFQGVKFKGQKQKNFLDWLDNLEFKIYNIPKEDYLLYLDVPIKISQKLLLKKSKRQYTKNAKKDHHEKDVEYQAKVASLYKKLTSQKNNWIRINCVFGEKLLSPAQIHEKIWKVIEKIV